MKIAAWNTKGLNDPGKRRAVLEWAVKNHLLVFGLLETWDDVLHMELYAVRMGFLKARAMQVQQVQVRSDSRVAVQMIVGAFQPRWEVLWLVEEIHGLHDGFCSNSFIHNVREINSCVDYLAGFVRGVHDLDFNTSCLPEALSILVRNDASGMAYYRM
ncbi:uncharacterized protein LOC122664425 [Telopea speciosissima]|uniref:uncharacterized protein LOC122664425 n=1 Tax=Telopea speciosissima TaxID=54955 RepID=UPI001CC70A7E|nr:uncharacterized protein LOC122664425 [Telopea speciosissima]